MNNKELIMLQSIPFEIKIAKSKLRIEEAIRHFGKDGIYVPVSGGKDSQVLSHLVGQVQKEMNIPIKDIPRVNSNTGNEYPEVLSKARELSDVEVKPKRNFVEILTTLGYPIGSKMTSRKISDLQNPTPRNKQSRRLYMGGIKLDGTYSPNSKLAKKWYKLIDSDIRVTHKCCKYLKKEPLIMYEKETGRKPLLGTMADEGGSRKTSYMQTGCNAFKQGKSLPIGFWTEQDILKYILKYDLEIASVYGEIKEDSEGKLYTTGESRTGCVACVYGIQYEDKDNNRFHRLKEINPRFYNFCINGGTHDSKGKWIPKNGLGLGKILDFLEINYK